MQLGIAFYHDAEVEVFDIPVAYLNAYLKPDKRQVMRIPAYIVKMIQQVDPTVMVHYWSKSWEHYMVTQRALSFETSISLPLW